MDPESPSLQAHFRIGKYCRQRYSTQNRRKYSAEEKIRVVLDGMRGEDSIAELCRREGINQNVYYRWSKEFLEAGKHAWPVIPNEKPPPRKSLISKKRTTS